MIHEVSGDILLTQANAIVHGVSPDDHFNQGLALSLRERWPSLAKDFRHWSHQTSPKPGTLWTWGGPGGARIVCLITQESTTQSHGTHGSKGHIEFVNHALKELRKVVDRESFASIALPRLATGAGGLKWSDVEPLLQHHLGDLKIPVYVYVEYRAGHAAEELESAK